MNLLDMLEHSEHFTETDKIIAEYFLSHKEQIKDCKLGTVAKETFSSNASVIRLCQKLGCNSYKDFQIAFVFELERKRNAITDVNFNYPFASSDTTRDITKKLSVLMKETADICYNSVSQDALEEAARWIIQANHLYVYGVGNSYLSALSFSYELNKLGILTIQPTQFNESVAISATATKEDVAFFVSYSGDYVHMMKKELSLLQKNHCKIILVTAADTAPEADLLIHFPKEEELSEKISIFYSQFALRYILSCLYSVIFAMDYPKNSKNRQMIEEYSRSE